MSSKSIDTKTAAGWVVVLTGISAVMAALDTLVVATARRPPDRRGGGGPGRGPRLGTRRTWRSSDVTGHGSLQGQAAR
jgi:hypothetical protein